MSQNDSVEPPRAGDPPTAVQEKMRAILDKMSGSLQKGIDAAEGHSPEQTEMMDAFGTMLKDLRYPVGKDGSVMNADFFAPFVAYHLVRCGWRPNGEKRKIKPRKVPGKGMVEDAVEWVDMDEADDPLRHLDTMSMADVAMLPEVWRYEAIRRLGGRVKNDVPEPKQGWKVNTKINVADMSRDPNELFR